MADAGLRLLKALSDDTRLKIVKTLLRGERCACEIPKMVGKAQPTVSLALKKLRAAGVVACRRDGAKCIYRVCDPRVGRIMEAAV